MALAANMKVKGTLSTDSAINTKGKKPLQSVSVSERLIGTCWRGRTVAARDSRKFDERERKTTRK